MIARGDGGMLTLNELLSVLTTLKAKHGGELPVLVNDTHCNVIAITNAKKVGGSFDAIQLEHTP